MSSRRSFNNQVRNEFLGMFPFPNKQYEEQTEVPPHSVHKLPRMNEESPCHEFSFSETDTDDQWESWNEFFTGFDTSETGLNGNESFSDESEYKSESDLQLSLAEELLFLFLTYNPPRRFIEHLLALLRQHGVPGIPSSVYLLMKSLKSVSIDILNIEKGDFAYLGVQQNLEFLIDKGFLLSSLKESALINLKLNIDGLPLFRSSRINLWPVLMQAADCKKVVPISVFCGIGKPKLEPFSQRLCAELIDLQKNGFSYRGLRVKIGSIMCVCDSPARSFVLCTKGHTSKDGCHWCRQFGTYTMDRVAYSSQLSALREDACYANFDETNQLSVTPFMNVVPLFSGFPPDFMHVVCLGVMRKMLRCYCMPIKGIRLSCRLPLSQIKQLNDRIESIRKFIPTDFQRKPRTVSELEYFKATEFRMFLLYIGPLLFKSILPTQFYKHFLMLHFSIYVYSSTKYQMLHDAAEQCLNSFVHLFPILFHPCLLSFNVHALLHIPFFTKLYGPVDQFSAFNYENYLSAVKRRIRANNGIFKQTLNQLCQIRSLLNLSNDQTQLSFTTSSPNNCALTEAGEVIIVTYVSGPFVSGTLLSFSRDLYSYPYPSSNLGIGYYSVTKNHIKNVIPANKAILVPFDTEYLVIPFIS